MFYDCKLLVGGCIILYLRWVVQHGPRDHPLVLKWLRAYRVAWTLFYLFMGPRWSTEISKSFGCLSSKLGWIGRVALSCRRENGSRVRPAIPPHPHAEKNHTRYYYYCVRRSSQCCLIKFLLLSYSIHIQPINPWRNQLEIGKEPVTPGYGSNELPNWKRIHKGTFPPKKKTMYSQMNCLIENEYIRELSLPQKNNLCIPKWIAQLKTNTYSELSWNFSIHNLINHQNFRTLKSKYFI